MNDSWVNIGPLIVVVLGFIYGIYKDCQNKNLRKEVQEKDNRLQANFMYEKVRTKREILEDKLTELISLDDNSSLTEKQRVLLQTYNKFVSLYNEIEDFCTKIFDDAIKSESYIKETILPVLNELAEYQIEMFKELNNYANKYNLKPIKKPDYKAFDKYDKFLIKYNGGETSHFWRKLKNTRRDSGFE